jgi:hypothetical protein
MKHIEHTIDIDASAETVWAIVADVAAYGTWNTFMTIDGAVAQRGDRPKVTIRPGTRAMTFRPTITAVVPGSTISWLGRVLLPRVFDGAHELHVEDLGDGRSRFTQRETFRGVLVPLLRTVLRDTEAGFAAMDAALARRAEERDALSRSS